MNPRTPVLVLALAVVGLGVALFLEQRTSRDLAAQVTRLSRQNAGLRYDLKQATQKAEALEIRAVALDSQLGSAKTRTTATESKHIQVSRELHETKTLLTEREQREVALMTELATLREKLAAASSPAMAALVAPPGPTIDADSYAQRIAELERQLTELLTRALAEPVEPPTKEPAPVQSASHQVVRVGPRDSFVVLDYGRQQGARTGDIVRLQRGTSALARVQISDARPRFSLAQVLPDTLKGQLQTGDLVVLEN